MLTPLPAHPRPERRDRASALSANAVAPQAHELGPPRVRLYGGPPLADADRRVTGLADALRRQFSLTVTTSGGITLD